MGRFARKHTGLEKQDFRQIFRNSKRYTEGSLVVLSVQGRLASPRLGMAVSKKHLARAVDRNRIKRLIRESFMHNRQYLDKRDIIVMSRPGLVKLSNQQVFHLLDKLWAKITNH